MKKTIPSAKQIVTSWKLGALAIPVVAVLASCQPGSDVQVTVEATSTNGVSAMEALQVQLRNTSPMDGECQRRRHGCRCRTGGAIGAGGTASGGASGSGGAGTGGVATGGAGGTGGPPAGTVSVSVAPGASPATAKVDVSLVDTTDSIASIAVSVAPDNVTASASGGATAVTVSGLAPTTLHAFTVEVTTSSGTLLTSTTNPLAFYDVVEVFTEPMVDNSSFTGYYTLDTIAGMVSNLQGVLFDGMYDTTVALTHQLSAQPATLGGVRGHLVATFALSTTDTFTGGGWAPGGIKTFGNYNAYALIFVPVSDPTQVLTVDQINWLAYADCTADGLMGKTCMTGTTVEAYGRAGTMGGYPTSQITTLR